MEVIDISIMEISTLKNLLTYLTDTLHTHCIITQAMNSFTAFCLLFTIANSHTPLQPCLACSGLELFIADDITLHSTVNKHCKMGPFFSTIWPWRAPEGSWFHFTIYVINLHAVLNDVHELQLFAVALLTGVDPM